MTNVLSPYAKQQFFNNNGGFNAGGSVTTYAAGTTTPIATYTSSGGTNTNPIVLNSRGECDIWLLPNTGYKFVLADAAGNTIWTIDNIVNSQLITLYGGVDTGSPNAYILNFTANFSALTDGIVIYWIPANSNTGASTLNVNGLGVIPITNQSGSALTAQQIYANQVAVVMYKGGNWLLVSSGQTTVAANTFFLANRSISAGPQSLTGNSTTTIIFDAAPINRASAYNTSTGLFTAPYGGIYTFTATIHITAGGSPSTYGPYYISKNLTYSVGNQWNMTGLFSGESSGSAPANSIGTFGTTATFSLNIGDTISIRCQMPNPGAGFTAAGDGLSCQFSGYQIG